MGNQGLLIKGLLDVEEYARIGMHDEVDKIESVKKIFIRVATIYIITWILLRTTM